MKKIIGAIILGIALIGNAVAQEAAVPDMPVGEHLIYKITWLNIPIGTGQVWIKEKTQLRGRQVFHVMARIETNQVLRTIFPMRDEIESWIDAERFESLQFEKNVRNKKVKSHDRVVFDSAKQKGYFESFTTGRKKEFDVIAPTHDFLSAFFWVRHQNLADGESVKAVISGDQKDWHLTAKVLKKEMMKRGNEKVNTLVVEADTSLPAEKKNWKPVLYLTEDASRTPLKIKHKAPFGHVVGTLQQAGQKKAKQVSG